MKRPFWIYNKKSGGLVFSEAVAESEAQAVGYYVSRILKKAWRKNDFFATKIGPSRKETNGFSQQEINAACPYCGCIDPLFQQASHCPNCEVAREPAVLLSAI